MKNKTNIFKFLLGVICLLLGLALINSVVYAVDKAELKTEVEKTYQELKAANPEAAQEFIKEYREAVKSGEITLEKTEGEAADRIGEEGAKEGERRYTEADHQKMESEFQTLLKEGKTPQEADKIMREKYGEPEDAPDYDLSKPEDRAMALKEFDANYKELEVAGISKEMLEQLREAIARGDEDLADKMFNEIDEKLGPEFEGRYGDEEKDFDLSKPEERVMALKEFDQEYKELEAAGIGKETLEQLREAIERGDVDIVDKMFDEIDDKIGPEFDDRGPGDFERFGPEDKDEFESMSKEEMDERFREEMGREPTTEERDMMERGDFERSDDVDREEFDRDYDYDRPEFDRPEYEREGLDRDELDREPPERENEPPPEEEQNP